MNQQPPTMTRAAALFACLVLLCASGAAPGFAQQPAKKVLLIGLDGVRVDVLAQAETPHIDALIAEGTYSDAAQTRMPTVSGPGWSSMLTGVWADKHGVLGNEFSTNDYAHYPDFLTRLEQVDPSFSTFAVLDWPPLGNTDSGGPLVSDTVDVKVLINGDALGYAEADALAADVAADYLAHQDPDAAFVYFGDIDVVGHEKGSLDPAYRAAIETADARVGGLIDALRGRPTYAQEDWLILMSTDHGRRDDGGHGEDSALEKTIFYLASGPSALKGRAAVAPGIVDVAVTALAHLGVTLDPAWRLDGTVVGLREE